MKGMTKVTELTHLAHAEFTESVLLRYRVCPSLGVSVVLESKEGLDWWSEVYKVYIGEGGAAW